MADQGKPIIPATTFLESIERHYSVRYPREFKTLCSAGGSAEASIAILHAAGVEFVGDLDTFRAVNTKVGEQEWEDYEMAIAGRRHPKDANRLWGGILPFATRGDEVFGFDLEQPQSDQVLVWSVHTVVHVYPSLSLFCATAGAPQVAQAPGGNEAAEQRIGADERRSG